MKYTIKRQDGKAIIKFTIPMDKWEECMENAYQKNKNKYSHQGFRKGHVPRKVIENIYGPQVFVEDAFNDSFLQFYGAVLDENKDLFPVEMPSVDFDALNDDGFKFSATVTLKPEVTLGKYTGLSIPKVKVEITDDMIDSELKSVQDKNARLIDVDRPVQDGDEISLDYSGAVDGVKFDGGTAQNQHLVIGSKTFIPGFEEQLIGVNKGETKDINVKFPKEYHAKELADKDAVFTVVVHDIKCKELQEINDDFAKDFSEFDTLNEYKEDIRKNLFERKRKSADTEEENKLLEEIVKQARMDIPQCMIETQIDSYIEEFEYSLKYQGLNMDDYLKYTNTTKEDLRKQYAERANKAVQTRLVLEAIVKAEKIKVTKKETDSKIAKLAKEAQKSTDEFKESMNASYLEYIENQLLVEKVLAFLKKENSIID
ncbi:MAG: trigger factor [Clostridia bacterium]|nr:trigger factor [Clostridia bacterium]